MCDDVSEIEIKNLFKDGNNKPKKKQKANEYHANNKLKNKKRIWIGQV